jgi:RHS repeat-associated protein
VVDGAGQQLTEVDSGNNWLHSNIYANGRQIGTFDGTVSNPALHYYFDDPLGTRRAQANGTGALEAQYQSLPFGDSLTPTFAAGFNPDDPTENHFTGKERDTESGNDYMFARYYNSATGRFLSPDWDAKSDDPVPYAKLDDPQSLNLYSYVYNNPLGKADPDGHWPAWALAGGGTLGAIGEGVAILSNPITASLAAAGAAAALLGRAVQANPNVDLHQGCMACSAGPSTYAEQKAATPAAPIGGTVPPPPAKARFIGEPNGNLVDTHSTPRGSYIQPNGGRTDVLQGEDHGAGHSHTHDPIVNTSPTGK